MAQSGEDDRRRILAATRAWAEAFAVLDAGALDRMTALADPAIRFRDPFNDVTGHAALARIFQDMFETCLDPRFKILDVAASGEAGYIRWVFRFRPKAMTRGPDWRVEGMSEIHVGPDGLVTAHLDHWDSGSQMLAKLPGIGALVRWVLRRFRVSAD
jgi:ketosteroid isomerase-like protein